MENRLAKIVPGRCEEEVPEGTRRLNQNHELYVARGAGWKCSLPENHAGRHEAWSGHNPAGRASALSYVWDYTIIEDEFLDIR